MSIVQKEDLAKVLKDEDPITAKALKEAFLFDQKRNRK